MAGIRTSRGVANLVRGSGFLLSKAFKRAENRDLVEGTFAQLGDALEEGVEVELLVSRPARRKGKGGDRDR